MSLRKDFEAAKKVARRYGISVAPDDSIESLVRNILTILSARNQLYKARKSASKKMTFNLPVHKHKYIASGGDKAKIHDADHYRICSCRLETYADDIVRALNYFVGEISERGHK